MTYIHQKKLSKIKKKCKLNYERLVICDSLGEYKKTQVKITTAKHRMVAKVFIIF